MAALTRPAFYSSAKSRQIWKLLIPCCQQRRHFAISKALQAGNWDENWTAGLYPKTEEESIAAAKKYGLHPSEYKPFPDDGMGHGDYPVVKDEAYVNKSDMHDWDNRGLKQNYNEPMNWNAEMLIPGRLDPESHEEGPYTVPYMVFSCLFHFGLMCAIIYFSKKYLLLNGSGFTLPQQYPWNDHWVEKGGDPENMPIVKHYTFEPLEQPSQ